MLNKLKEDFLNPASEFTPIPFWFWNDCLDKDEIIRQINGFKEKGVDGFVIHPRIGIPEAIEYLSDTYMEYVETAVEEASRLKMTVFLYDEAMYPSGSAHGKVVEGNPEYASRGLKMIECPCEGETEINVKLEKGESLVSAQAVIKISEREINPDSIRKLGFDNGKIKFIPSKEGKWSVLVFIETFTGGKIRGIHFGEDSCEAGAPPSADLLNPDAVKKFIKLTHERYYEKLGKYFGTTIKAIFTDEPSIMGRGAIPGLIPWTSGFLHWYMEQGNLETYLPLLWFDGGKDTAFVRKMYNKALNLRLVMSYYKPISEWCSRHNIALAGHPHASDEIGVLKYFHIPGQDIVLRWVAPEEGKALEGRDSTMGKCSSDAARHTGKRRNLNECFGCCVTYRPGQGWNLPSGDMKWYMDWLFVRGVNLIIPHAFYYSIRGKRAYERPPDVGPNNIWWPYYNIISKYIKRMSWLMTDSINITEIAVLCEENHLPWKVVKPLYQNQIEFNYLEDNLFISPACKLDNGWICIENQRYRVLIIENKEVITGRIKRDQETLLEMETVLETRLKEFISSGGIVIVYDPGDAEGADETGGTFNCVCNNSDNVAYNSVYDDVSNYNLEKSNPVGVYKSGGIYKINHINKLVELLDRFIKRDVVLIPSNDDLRVSHVVKGGVHFYLLVNEGEESIKGELKTNVIGRVEKWDAWNGKCEEIVVHGETVASEARIPLLLQRRESAILCIDTSRPPNIETSNIVRRETMRRIKELKPDNEWDIRIDGHKVDGSFMHKSWTQWPGMEDYWGTVSYKNEFVIDGDEMENITSVVLDLGEVYEIAHIYINSKEAGVKMWSPYVCNITEFVKYGINTLQIEVTNSIANKMDKSRLPSGLLGPVRIMIEENDWT